MIKVSTFCVNWRKKMKQENQRVMLTKRLIREALVELLKAKNLRQISVRELCERAEINRTTFYKHYGSPDQVLQEILSDQIQNVIDLADNNGKPVSTPDFLERMCEYMWANRNLHKVLFSSQTGTEESDLFRLCANAMWSVRTFRPEMENLDPITDKAAMLFVESGCYAVFRWWLLEDVNQTPKEIAHIICRLIGLEHGA